MRTTATLVLVTVAINVLVLAPSAPAQAANPICSTAVGTSPATPSGPSTTATVLSVADQATAFNPPANPIASFPSAQAIDTVDASGTRSRSDQYLIDDVRFVN